MTTKTKQHKTQASDWVKNRGLGQSQASVERSPAPLVHSSEGVMNWRRVWWGSFAPASALWRANEVP